MQPAIYIISDPYRLHLSWKTHETHSITQNTYLKKSKLALKTLPVSKSLRTSCYYEFEGIDRGDGPATAVTLPVVIRRSGRVSRYSWDGTHLNLVSLDGNVSNCFTFDDRIRKFFQICSTAFRDFFIPQQVHGSYMDYVKWKFLHRVFSSALQVLATQAMFRAIGIGFSRSLPSAAALNWVLKDGLGRLSRCIYTASVASAFDTKLKWIRFSTSVLFSLSIGVELLTPIFPQYFLLLATLANIAKQISLACYLATGSAVHRSFAIADNLGEVSAKGQIQTVCFDNLGLLLAAFLNILCKNSQRLQASLPFVVYPIFSAIDIFGIYQGLKHVHLQTLTKDRLEIVLNSWIQLGYIPSPAEVSKKEGIEFPWCKGREMWPIRIGCIDPKNPVPRLLMPTMRSLKREDFYFICSEFLFRGLAKNEQHGILLCLREGASTTDIIMGLMQACHVRNALLLDISRWECILEASEASDIALKEWFQMIEDSNRCAQRDVNLLKEEIQRSGWAVKNILLSVQEQMRYSFVETSDRSCGNLGGSTPLPDFGADFNQKVDGL